MSSARTRACIRVVGGPQSKIGLQSELVTCSSRTTRMRPGGRTHEVRYPTTDPPKFPRTYAYTNLEGVQTRFFDGGIVISNLEIRPLFLILWARLGPSFLLLFKAKMGQLRVILGSSLAHFNFFNFLAARSAKGGKVASFHA